MAKRSPLAGLAGTVLALLLSPGIAAGAAASRPLGIPALQEFIPAGGTWTIGAQPQIVVRPRDRTRLRREAAQLARDLSAVLGRAVRISAGRRGRRGDIVLARSGRSARLGAEGYRLRINRAFTILASTGTGVFYGGRTLLQLVQSGQPISRGRAQDWPRYPQRGLMLDLGRRPYPLAWLEAYVSDMGYLKLNLLHLHLTDDQRWGIVSDSHPEIVTPGALTKAQVRRLLRVARRHHVEIVPEIDMPAHAGSILAAHPELELRDATGGGPSLFWRNLDISNDAARALVKDLLEEYLPLFPGRYWHMGGDEYLTPTRQALFPQLLLDAQRRYGPSATVNDEVNGFYNWVHRIVRAHGKTLRAWSDQFTPGTTVALDAAILAEWWSGVSPLSEPRTRTPAELLADGHRIMNAGWFPTYYAEDIGRVEGRPDPADAYETWSVNQFCSARIDGVFIVPCLQVAADDERLVGAKINAWGQAGTTLEQIAEDLFPRLRMIAQKTWDSPPLAPSYPEFAEIMQTLGHAPGYVPPS